MKTKNKCGLSRMWVSLLLCSWFEGSTTHVFAIGCGCNLTGKSSAKLMPPDVKLVLPLCAHTVGVNKRQMLILCDQGLSKMLVCMRFCVNLWICEDPRVHLYYFHVFYDSEWRVFGLWLLVGYKKHSEDVSLRSYDEHFLHVFYHYKD